MAVTYYLRARRLVPNVLAPGFPVRTIGSSHTTREIQDEVHDPHAVPAHVAVLSGGIGAERRERWLRARRFGRCRQESFRPVLAHCPMDRSQGDRRVR